MKALLWEEWRRDEARLPSTRSHTNSRRSPSSLGSRQCLGSNSTSGSSASQRRSLGHTVNIIVQFAPNETEKCILWLFSIKSNQFGDFWNFDSLRAVYSKGWKRRWSFLKAIVAKRNRKLSSNIPAVDTWQDDKSSTIRNADLIYLLGYFKITKKLVSS